MLDRHTRVGPTHMSSQVEIREAAFGQFQEEITEKISNLQYTSGRKVLERHTKNPKQKDKKIQCAASQLDEKVEEDMRALEANFKEVKEKEKL